MLCQNCGKNEAVTHLRRIINGETVELHLCPSCSVAMGYSMGFSPLGFGFGDILGGMFSDLTQNIASKRIVRCEKCGFTLDEFSKTGKVGCEECYNVFGDKINSYFEKINPDVVYMGRHPDNKDMNENDTDIIDMLKMKLNEAVQTQNFELAARIRDEIKIREPMIK